MRKIKNKGVNGYLSWSQMNMFETNPNQYYRCYVEKQPMYINKYMIFGSRVHKAIEIGFDKKHNSTIDMLSVFVPTYPKREFKLSIDFEGIPLYGIIDGFNPWNKSFGDYKVAKNQTQADADKSGQFTFYAFMIWLKYKTIPKKIFLHWIETKEDENKILFATGNFKTFQTERTLKDIILFSKRLKTVWAGICKLGGDINSK